ncbi:MAG: AAA family ATPase [Anaerolineales bacterium]|nr:AAA family ATPase [Anaerolineales bacterium]
MLIIHTKLTPPRPSKRTLHRPRLTQRLLETRDRRLAILQAGTGYGKSTAVAALQQIQQKTPIVWYHLSHEDADPLVFLHHLLAGFAAQLPNLSSAPSARLEEWERNRTAVSHSVVDALNNELAQHLPPDSYLVLDDAHHLNQSSETLAILDRLISLAPRQLHFILTTRYPLNLPSLVKWRVHGDVLDIGQTELAFTAVEMRDLFQQQYNLTLTNEQTDLLSQRTEGWPIALPLVWQHLQRDPAAQLPAVLNRVLGSAADLFTYLTQEVLAQQTPEIQQFLRITSVLRTMTPRLCNDLRQAHDSDYILRYLREHALFVVDIGAGHMRYHHLFRDFLQHQLDPAEARAYHERTAVLYQEQGEPEEAIYHLLAASALPEAAQQLAQHGRVLIRAGRLDTLAGWLSHLPPEILADHPPLLVYQGDIARLRSHFEDALDWYQQAERLCRQRNDSRGLGMALRGQARVYIDTVNPSQAETLLQEALRIADGQADRHSYARLLDLLAENMLNLGRFKQAETYQQEARHLRQEGPSAVELPVRMLLRTGRLDEARRLLEEQVTAEKQNPVLRPRAHRETQLLLSLILTFQGEREPAYASALAGTRRGEALQSEFIRFVGINRQGHAWLLLKNETGYEKALHCFQEAIHLSERMAVPRLKVESFWGLTQAYGFRGDLSMAQYTAEQGINIAHTAGDEWVESCVRIALAASYVLAGVYDTAVPMLEQTSTSFHECGDTYGVAVTRLWQCLVWHATQDTTRLTRDLTDLLALAHQHRYGYLFQRATLMGPPDFRALIPLLLFARQAKIETAYVERLLTQMGLPQIELHPGYQLRIQTLGAFQLWRGAEEVPHGDWKRHKARQLFLLLVTEHGRLLEREQLTDRLWPELDPESGERDFKIAYTTLCKVLEPERDRKAPSAFVARDGTRYGLRPEADIWLDTAVFETLIEEGQRRLLNDTPTAQTAAMQAYQQALDLYQGDYLQAYPYEEWCHEERERLRILYLRTAERLARLHAKQDNWEAVIQLSEAILARDACWEQAYRLLMQAHAALGQRPQLLRTYQQCVARLQEELHVSPTAVTQQLYKDLSGQP